MNTARASRRSHMISSLNQQTLREVAPRCRVPRYDRAALHAGIVHIGVGGFNRSHLCVYLDDLLNCGEARAWAEFGIGLLPPDKPLSEALAAQNCLYGVLERDGGNQFYRVIGSLAGHLYAPDGPAQAIARLAAPETKIISLTVTEGGYFFDDATGAFLGHDAAIIADLQAPAAPCTWLGFVAAAAEQRMQSGRAGFTLLSCDNLRGNGDTARTALLRFAQLRGAKLHQWIAANVTFPNSMVDRITPRTTDADRETIAREYGVRDLAPVVCEPFRQWVLEDKFAAGRPAWERVGAQFTTDVVSYEKTKMRLLNAAHFTLAYVSALLGIQFVAEAVTDADVRSLIQAFQREAQATLTDLPGINLREYSATVLTRFANPAIRDQIARICSDATAKFGKYILPVAKDLHAAGPPASIAAFVIASWLRYLEGRTEAGDDLTIEDLQCHAVAGHVRERRIAAALAEPAVFGRLFADAPGFAAAVERHLAAMHDLGIRAAIRSCLKEQNA